MAMSLLGGLTATLIGAAALSVGVASHAGADPFPPVSAGQSASDTIDDLEAHGYDVRINWLTGYDTKPLSQCRATNVNNPGHMAPTEGTFTTVYVDVVCPNGDDDGGDFNLGVGIG